MCHISTDRGNIRLLFGVLFVKIPCGDPEISLFNLMGGQPLLSILNHTLRTVIQLIQLI